MFRRSWRQLCQVNVSHTTITSSSMTNQWAKHVSSRRSASEVYNALVLKGVIEQNDSQKEVVQICDHLLNFVNDENQFSKCCHLLEKEWEDQQKVKQRQGEYETPEAGTMRGRSKVLFKHTLEDSLKKWETMKTQAAKKSQAVGTRRTLKFGSSTIEWPDASALDAEEEAIRHTLQGGSMGLYLWGDVGIGKTMMMDIFEMCETPKHSKRRAHLHGFVTELHQRLHVVQLEQQERRRKGLPLIEPIEKVALDIVKETRILCLDEFQTFDVANASLLAGFFRHAFRLGIVLFATSNRPPEGLLKAHKSLKRFVPLLRAHCAVVQTEKLTYDYRSQKAELGALHGVIYQFPNSSELAHRLLSFVGSGFTGASAVAFANGDWERNVRCSVFNRTLRIPRRLSGVAVFPFSHICGFGQMLAPADFQLIAMTFHTVVITDVPHVAISSKNGLKQWILLIDELYQHHVKLLFTAAVPWDKLMVIPKSHTQDMRSYYTEEQDERTKIDPTQEVFNEDDLFDFRTHEEILSMARVASRLTEMGSVSYLTKDHLDFVIEDFDLRIYERGIPQLHGGSGGGEGTTTTHVIS